MSSRRHAFFAIPGLITLPALAACSRGGEEDVGAVEDLMREHGILRRIILVFRDSADRLGGAQIVNAGALHKAAQLFRSFGEDYHERKLEEENIFPALRKVGGTAAAMVDTLIAQHNRGREIIDYVMSATRGAIVEGQGLVALLQQFELTYANHAAREDTIIFPAWKKAIGAQGVEEMGEKFEDIEKRQFGGDGFDMAVQQIAEIEQALGLTDLAQFTAAPASPSSGRGKG
jgi:hemerythrin-like domain-containing protein